MIRIRDPKNFACALLFLGFRIDDWNFRVLFRSIMSQEGRSRRHKYAHIAGQILPEEGRFLEPERARSYLESYFQDADISIYWGSVEDVPFLHFELCYYQAVEWGIAHGMRRVEAGAQGEHKLARGYEPVTTHSAHWIADPSFRRAVANYLTQERAQVAHDVDVLSGFTPFRRGEAPEAE